ncbi:hypothetical protein [Massilia sp. IC2-476]|uniref:hypothetical protein n=1 Tax=Massilia sp. IC2-476 TaxID=2887199 RepID=UPI001D1172EC|nr:hypothetical protein [Massilia sp. IC2-476]MCC2974703.1 hypothetical protein [Massilia sp. IC2-476]
MNRSALFLVLFGLIATPLAHADEPSVCKSVCTSEKEQCTVRARKLTELDKLPTPEEKNPFAQTAERAGQLPSVSGHATERLAAQRRNRERTDACDATYKRCTNSCAPIALGTEHAAAVN